MANPSAMMRSSKRGRWCGLVAVPLNDVPGALLDMRITFTVSLVITSQAYH